MTQNSDAKAGFLKMPPGAYLKAFNDIKEEEKAKASKAKAGKPGKLSMSIPRDEEEFDQEEWLRLRNEKLARKRRIPR